MIAVELRAGRAALSALIVAAAIAAAWQAAPRVAIESAAPSAWPAASLFSRRALYCEVLRRGWRQACVTMTPEPGSE